MNKLEKPTYEWAPSSVAVMLTVVVCWITFTWEMDLIYPAVKELPNWTFSVISVAFFLYFVFLKPFLILKCIGLLLYVYVKLTTKYE